VDDLKEVIDFILCRTRFGIGSGSVIKHCVIVVFVVLMMTKTKTICCFASN